jgi:hypothetical protein
MHASREMLVFPCIHIRFFHTNLAPDQSMMNLMTIGVNTSARYELVDIECN